MSTVQDQDTATNREDDTDDIARLFLEMWETVRKNLTAHVLVECHKEADLQYLIKTTQALINSNNEIWGRCKDNLHHKNKPCHQQKGEKVKLKFYRVGFHIVEASPGLSEDNKTENIVVQTRCLWQTKIFCVPCLPCRLSAVTPPIISESGMVNYLEYCKSFFSLEESVWLPFLAILKDHLEEFQIFLGDVESWLLGSSRSAIFIQDTFSVPVEVVVEKEHTLGFSNNCIHCGALYFEHNQRKTFDN